MQISSTHAALWFVSVTTPSTRSRRVTSSRTSVYSWSTSTRLRPRRPARRSLATRWRPAVSRTRYAAILIFVSFHVLTALLGGSRASCCPCCGEEARDYCCRARCARPGVNPINPPLSPTRCTSSITGLPSYQYAVSYAMRLTPIRQAHAPMLYMVLRSQLRSRADPGLISEVETRSVCTMYMYRLTHGVNATRYV